MTPSAFVRAAAMRHKVTVVPGVKEMTHELKAIGRNLNQLAILSHEGKVQFPNLGPEEWFFLLMPLAALALILSALFGGWSTLSQLLP